MLYSCVIRIKHSVKVVDLNLDFSSNLCLQDLAFKWPCRSLTQDLCCFILSLLLSSLGVLRLSHQAYKGSLSLLLPSRIELSLCNVDSL